LSVKYSFINEEITLKEQAQKNTDNTRRWQSIDLDDNCKTEGFTAFTDPREMACYAGVVPFDHQSGTSVKYKSKVSIMQTKNSRVFLHLAAMSGIRLIQ
jgi:hypothetical protein